MKTKLQHSDDILAAPAGSWLIACDTISGVDMRACSIVNYGPGARFRVKMVTGGLIWCDDEEARSVSFDREEMFALERESSRGDVNG